MAFDLPIELEIPSANNSGALTLSFRQATQAVIFRDISGIFLSPNDSRKAIAADLGFILGNQLLECKSLVVKSLETAMVRREGRALVIDPPRRSCRPAEWSGPLATLRELAS